MGKPKPTDAHQNVTALPDFKEIVVPKESLQESPAQPVTDQNLVTENYNDIKTLQKTINEFAQLRKQQDKILEYTLLYEKPFTLKENQLTFDVHNEIEGSLLKELKQTLLTYLESALQAKFTISYTVNENPETKKVYSPSEKLKILSEQYPLIDDLKRRLGLELDF